MKKLISILLVLILCVGAFPLPVFSQEIDYQYTNNEKECFGPFILITENESLRKKHRCYVVGHQEVVRLGYKLGCKSVDFGLFFDYKDSLNIPRTWLKGIMLKDKHLCYELAKINPNFEGICKELARHGKSVIAY